MINAVNVRYSINGAYRFLPQGQYYLHQAWSGDMCAAWGYVNSYTEKSFEALGYWFPEDRKGVIGNDLMTIPKDAQSPVLAHLFLNWMLDFTQAMNNFSWVGYQPPQNKANPDELTKTEGLYSKQSNWAPPISLVPPWMPAAVVRPDDFQTGYMELELTPPVDNLWHNAWQEFQAGAQ
jgi:spermidine/putrescine transport system substrate-binding protein